MAALVGRAGRFGGRLAASPGVRASALKKRRTPGSQPLRLSDWPRTVHACMCCMCTFVCIACGHSKRSSCCRMQHVTCMYLCFDRLQLGKIRRQSEPAQLVSGERDKAHAQNNRRSKDAPESRRTAEKKGDSRKSEQDSSRRRAFSQVPSLLSVYGEYTRALTFDNYLPGTHNNAPRATVSFLRSRPHRLKMTLEVRPRRRAGAGVEVRGREGRSRTRTVKVIAGGLVTVEEGTQHESKIVERSQADTRSRTRRAHARVSALVVLRGRVAGMGPATLQEMQLRNLKRRALPNLHLKIPQHCR